LRVALIAQLPGLLDSLGCDPALLLRRAGIPARLLADSENRVDYRAVGRLLDEGVRATGLPHFGVLAGERFAPEVALGEVIELMVNSPTVEMALRALVLFHYMNDSGAAPALLPVNGRRVALSHFIFWPDVPARDTFYDAALAYGMQIMRRLCGANWQPLQVTFSHSAPADLAPYHRMFGRRLRFDANISAIEFEVDVLESPVVGADAERYAVLQNALRTRRIEAGGLLSDQVKLVLGAMILARTATAANVGELFSISDRTLRTRLAKEQATFRGLLRQTRLEMATQLLQSTKLSVSEIASAVGYADPPSFVRAFRGHFPGVTPGEWRGKEGLRATRP
jgi:AraC-like DNA-binding protein